MGRILQCIGLPGAVSKTYPYVNRSVDMKEIHFKIGINHKLGLLNI